MESDTPVDGMDEVRVLQSVTSTTHKRFDAMIDTLIFAYKDDHEMVERLEEHKKQFDRLVNSGFTELQAMRVLQFCMSAACMETPVVVETPVGTTETPVVDVGAKVEYLPSVGKIVECLPFVGEIVVMSVIVISVGIFLKWYLQSKIC